MKLLPDHTSSYLRPGSKFVGTQQSERQVYNVDVEIKHVDISESYMCGYLRIQGLFIPGLLYYTCLAMCPNFATASRKYRSHGRSPYPYHILRRRNNRNEAHVPDTT